jgi:hypothetical protein
VSDAGERRKKGGRGFLPYTYIVGRLLVVVPMLLIIVFVGAGFAGWGPGHRLHGAAAVPAAHWVTGSQPQPEHHRLHKHHHHKKHHHGRANRHKHKHHHHKGKKKERGQSG